MRILLLAAALPLTASALFGWGCEGHQIVALIARAHLTAAASAAVDQLLRANPIDPELSRFCQNRPGDLMADASTWADDVRKIEWTGAWHYIDVPRSIDSGDAMAYCPPIGPVVDEKDRSGCIVNAIDYELAILRDRTRPGAERATALRYIIHFFGDLHQPLHTADNDDKGGNCTSMQFFSEESTANLHAIWDYKIIVRKLAQAHSSQAQYATLLNQRFAKRWNDWGEGEISIISWAWEGHKLAEDVTYGDLMPHIPIVAPDAKIDCDTERDRVAGLHITVGQKYFNQSVPVIEEQLAKGGFRLAGLLNRTFGWR